MYLAAELQISSIIKYGYSLFQVALSLDMQDGYLTGQKKIEISKMKKRHYINSSSPTITLEDSVLRSHWSP